MKNVRGEFPIFKRQNGLVYLDSAATSLKPSGVISAMNKYYGNYTANVNRGLYKSAVKTDFEYEKVRMVIAEFIGARNRNEIVFVSGTTEGLNGITQSIGKAKIGAGSEVWVTEMEHHSNLLPWQRLCGERKAKLKFLKVDRNGEIEKKIRGKPAILAISLVGNVLGTVNDVAELSRQAKRLNPECVVVVDGAQAVAHILIDVSKLGCDFLVFSGHKLYGPTGVGVVWGRKDLLSEMMPWKLGGGMVEMVSKQSHKFRKPPERLEAGTPNIAGVIGMGEAVKWIGKYKYAKRVGMEAVAEHEAELVKYCLEKLKNAGGIDVYGLGVVKRAGIISFNVRTQSPTKNQKYIHPHDVAQVLADRNICVRAGHHCAQVLHRKLGVQGSVRASFGVYTTHEDLDRLIEGIEEAKKRLG